VRTKLAEAERWRDFPQQRYDIEMFNATAEIEKNRNPFCDIERFEAITSVCFLCEVGQAARCAVNTSRSELSM